MTTAKLKALMEKCTQPRIALVNELHKAMIMRSAIGEMEMAMAKALVTAPPGTDFGNIFDKLTDAYARLTGRFEGFNEALKIVDRRRDLELQLYILDKREEWRTAMKPRVKEAAA